MNIPEMFLMIIDHHDECVICEVTVYLHVLVKDLSCMFSMK